MDLLKSQLKWLSKRWNFITPTHFEKVVSGRKFLKKDSLLVSFDDGFKSDFFVADKVLKPMNIKAIFFVITDFVEEERECQTLKFVRENLKLNPKESGLSDHLWSMNWEDLKKLRKMGHVIGAHTKSHKRLTQGLAKETLEVEIRDSAKVIEKKLGFKVQHFAFPFGDFASIGQDALQIASEHFDFVYSGLRGFNRDWGSAKILRRDSLTVHENVYTIGSFLEGACDLRYSSKAKLLDMHLAGKMGVKLL
ncbi:polysaccharide deacetylase family protein [Candidatus Puniceispirillum sp.]|nr:polysaccharide deacetylase family protein [Candidatus Puniceispirillum sp.]